MSAPTPYAIIRLAKVLHDTYRAAQQLRDWVIAEETAEAVRWELRGEPRTRETFSQPHPDDYTGSPVPAW